jgi:3,4-dihydroxy 2-butanone 4-phosphate synthase/GTP cyclohydrolase II
VKNIKKAISDIKKGKLVIVTDNPSRENEGDLVCAASKASPEKINFMAKFGRGLICVPMESDRLDKLEIPNMLEKSAEKRGCLFTVSVDSALTKTGISAYERALTIQKLIDANSKAQDFVRPGHIFPLRYKEGGVLARTGHTEAAVDLARLAGLYPAAVICEIMRDDGKMAKMPDLVKFAKLHNLTIISVDELVLYRKQTEIWAKEIVRVNFPTEFGTFKLSLFENSLTGENHLALIKGDIENKSNVIFRMHSSCETGDIFHSLRCDCGKQLAFALKTIEEKGCGVLLYLHQEGRGIGLANKIKAYKLQEEGMDTVEANIALGFDADLRDYSIAAWIIKCLKINSIQLMTNNPVKITELEKYGVKVNKRVPIEINPVKTNEKYLKTKKEKMKHILSKV